MRRAVPRGRRLHRAADPEGIPRRHLRADGRSAAREEAGEARDHPHRHAGHRDGIATCCARTRTTIWPRLRATDGRAGVAHVDISTGEFRVTEMDAAEVAAALENAGRARGAVPGELPLLGETPSRASRTEARRLDLHSRLRRPHPARPFQAAVARRLRARRTDRGRRRGGRDPALSARHAARRARSSRPADVSTTAPTPWCWTR